jgi:hypothetical protein
MPTLGGHEELYGVEMEGFSVDAEGFLLHSLFMAPMAETSTKLPETQEPGRQRVQIDFTPEAAERLQQIKEMAEAKTNAEVVRNALRLYEWFLRQKKENYTFQLLKDDMVKEVELFL